MSSGCPWHVCHRAQLSVPWKSALWLSPDPDGPAMDEGPGWPLAVLPALGGNVLRGDLFGLMGAYGPALSPFVRAAQTFFARSPLFLDFNVASALRSPRWVASTLLRSSESGDLFGRVLSSDAYPLGFLADAALTTFSCFLEYVTAVGNAPHFSCSFSTLPSALCPLRRSRRLRNPVIF